MGQPEFDAVDDRIDDNLRRVPCAVMRGGTSKGVLFRERDLPTNPTEREHTILGVMGSPDSRQIDGLGGADTLTSKVGIVGPSDDPDADVDYTFGQVSIDDASVDFEGNCGNISSAVSYFVIEEGLVERSEPVTKLRMLNTGTGTRMTAEVPVRDGRPRVTGEFAISGVPGTGARVNVGIENPGGAKTGATLPTGSVVDEIRLDGLPVECSLVDAGNPCLFVRASDVGLTGTEDPATIDDDADLIETVERLRVAFAVKSGLSASETEARETNTLLPLVVFVSEPQSYDAYGGGSVAADDISLVARMVFNERLHKAYAGTGSICTGVANQISGSVVERVAHPPTKNEDGRKVLTIGHPSGTMESLVNVTKDGDLREVLFRRTARRLMTGTAYISPTHPSQSSN